MYIHTHVARVLSIILQLNNKLSPPNTVYKKNCAIFVSRYSQEPITRSEHLPYLILELSFLQTELFLERLSRQANNAFVYWPTRAPHYFYNKWINYLDFPTFINMADSSDEFESDLSCESEYESVESSDEWESSAILDPPLIAP